MFSIQETLFNGRAFLLLALLVLSLVLGIVVSKLSEWNGNGGWRRNR